MATQIMRISHDKLYYQKRKFPTRKRLYSRKRKSSRSPSPRASLGSSPKRIKSHNASTIEEEFFAIRDEIMNDPEFLQYMLDFKFEKEQIDGAIEYCLSNEDFTDYAIDNFPEDLEDEDTVRENRMKITINFLRAEWHKLITDFINKQCLCALPSLKVIVLGSLGCDKFTKTCMVMEDKSVKESEIILSVKRFKKLLDEQYRTKRSKCDYYAEKARRKGFLFINTCLSENIYDIVNWHCTTKFVNLVILKWNAIHAKTANHLTVLDMRLPEHVNKDELDDRIIQDEELCDMIKNYEFEQTIFPLVEPIEDGRKVLNYFRLGAPIRWGEDDAVESEAIQNGIQQFVKDSNVSYIYEA